MARRGEASVNPVWRHSLNADYLQAGQIIDCQSVLLLLTLGRR
jgi:hypothetical protein